MISLTNFLVFPMQNKIQRKIVLPLVVLTSFFLSGCDDASNAIKSFYEKGTVDGVLSCIRENEDKSELISKELIKQKCFRKHEKRSSMRFASNCRGAVEMNSENSSVSLTGGCKNETDKFITSITTTISVRNLPTTEEHSVTFELMDNTNDQVEISPGESLYFKADGVVSERLKEIAKNDLPFCSDLKEDEVKPCKSWFLGDFKYLDLNI
jgi:hypothetical protein